ncbi:MULTISPECIES: peptidase domain-containing ABC transporter [Luteibacter]|uniref:peptidase domain-containing ABC transporter n=1 Tax=Luteibacter TaxID=242605 RepID=UPI00068B0BC8|nr:MULTISPECIES: peptidase domain-containing ABC transporter [unclassified Luteibacter]
MSDASSFETLGDDFSGHLLWRRRRHLPDVRQVEASECGLACLAMVLAWWGRHESLSELRRRFSVSAKGTTLEDLVGWSDALGLVSRPVRLELDELGELVTPCIVHWDLDHFVVLKSVSGRKVTIHDPAHGPRTLDVAEVGRRFTGVALELAAGPTFTTKKASPTLSLRKLAGSVKGLRGALGNIFGFALALEVVALLMPQFLQVVVDQVLADSDRDLLTLLGTGFVLLVIVQVVITAFRTWSVVWLGTHFTMNWTGNVFQHLMRLPQIYFMNRHLGDVVSRMGAINVIQQNLTTQLVGAVLDGLMAVATLVVLLLYSPMLTTIIVSGVVVYTLLRLAYFKAFQEANLSQIMVNAHQQSALMESVRGVQTIRLNNKGAARSARYLNQTGEALGTQVEVQRLGMVFGMMQGLTGGLQRVGVLWLGAWLALKGQMTAGMLMAFAAYGEQFASRSMALADYLIQVRLLRLQGERLSDIVLTPAEPFARGAYQGPPPEASVAFKGVRFRYSDSEPWVIDGCNFEVRRGEAVAIVGPSGCGKSTLLRLLLGLLDPQSGQVAVGGVELTRLGKVAYRERVGCVLQDDKLFAGSIADNIAFFDDNALPKAVQAAAEAAGLHDDICAMPMGYNTLVGDMGSSLSGGQQQRLFLARALYRKPDILVLDEATSHLDIAREQQIATTIGRMNITRIMVAHRPETIALADRVFFLSSGQLHEVPGPRLAVRPID